MSNSFPIYSISNDITDEFMQAAHIKYLDHLINYMRDGALMHSPARSKLRWTLTLTSYQQDDDMEVQP